jgi:hypothetical protein
MGYGKGAWTGVCEQQVDLDYGLDMDGDVSKLRDRHPMRCGVPVLGKARMFLSPQLIQLRAHTEVGNFKVKLILGATFMRGKKVGHGSEEFYGPAVGD